MDAMTPKPAENQLVIFDQTFTPAALFVPGTMDPLIEHIRKAVTSEVTDATTAEGRKRIKSLAMKVTKSKTAIDAARKDLVAGEKKRLAAIDAEGARVWKLLEALADEVRQPVTDFEKREDDRIEAHRLAVEAIKGMLNFISISGVPYAPDVVTIEGRLAEAEAVSTDHEEFTGIAIAAKTAAIETLTAKLSEARKAEADRVELERLRKEAAEREQRDREAAIAAKAKAEAEAAARRREEEAARISAEQLAKAEREKNEAKAAAEGAEQARIEAEKKANEDRLAAEAAAKRREEEAAQRERARIAAEQEREAEDTRKREADKAHRAKINNEALAGLMAATGIDEVGGKMFIGAVAKGQVPNVTINY